MLTEIEARRHVSANIVSLLENRGWKTLRLAELLDGIVAQNTVYRIARGETSGSVPALASIADALGVTVDYLITDHSSRMRSTSPRKHAVAS